MTSFRDPVRALILFTALASSLLFLWRGVALPLVDAFQDVDSHYELRGRYFGAIDLLHGQTRTTPPAIYRRSGRPRRTAPAAGRAPTCRSCWRCTCRSPRSASRRPK